MRNIHLHGALKWTDRSNKSRFPCKSIEYRMEMAWDGWRWLNGSKADLLLWVQLIHTDPFTLNVSIHAIHFPNSRVAHPVNICIYTTLHLDLHLRVISSRSGHSFPQFTRTNPSDWYNKCTTNQQLIPHFSLSIAIPIIYPIDVH